MALSNALDLFKDSIDSLSELYPPNESRALAFMLFEHLFDLSKTQVLSNAKIDLDEASKQVLGNYLCRLNTYEPIQHIIGNAYFLDLKFIVSPDVLIPRGETEELVIEITNRLKHKSHLKIADVCTGSGCIAISLVNELKNVEAVAIDISPKALEIARQNALINNLPIILIESDILANPLPVDELDLVVSNPPYVTEAEKKQMDRNVLDYEPHIALFVSNSDPLVFYNRIAKIAYESLKTNGLLAFEINESFGGAVESLLYRLGYQRVEIKKDIHGKDRMAFAYKPDQE